MKIVKQHSAKQQVLEKMNKVVIMLAAHLKM